MIEDVLRRLAALERRLEELETRDVANPLVIYSTDTARVLTNGAYTLINFEDKVYDPDSQVTIGASWHYTVPVSGLYVCGALITIASAAWAAGNAIRIQATVNGSAPYHIARQSGMAVTFAPTVAGIAVIEAAVDDQIAFEVFQNRGVDQNLSGDATYNYCYIYRVGAG